VGRIADEGGSTPGLTSELPVKSHFYEQVTDVKWFLSFPSLALFAFVVVR
jgi:hypothetical protein